SFSSWGINHYKIAALLVNVEYSTHLRRNFSTQVNVNPLLAINFPFICLGGVYCVICTRRKKLWEMGMEMEQELEWNKAQSIEISIDLLSAAKRQLNFLEAVDRHRWLYEGPALDMAIHRQEPDIFYFSRSFVSFKFSWINCSDLLSLILLSVIRYNACWLPLLAKHSESPLFEGPLVIPLDCEWVWHCHRLNPVRYKQDCEEFYGKILDNKNVVSTLEGTSRNYTEAIWKKMYPGETFELNTTSSRQDNTPVKPLAGEKYTKYDLVSAVQRQSPFFYQVSRRHTKDDRYIEGAVARYKGFLHLIKRNKEKGVKSFSVPTYDIDLIWHTHQLHPVFYCGDLLKIMGKVLEHDDTDSDRTKGQKLDVGFSGTTKTFEEMYGRRYWRAGAMYRGAAPSPVRMAPYYGATTKMESTCDGNGKISLPAVKAFEVMLEFVGVKNLPEGHKGSLIVSFSKTQPDMIFNATRSLTIFSESREKQVAYFQCQASGRLLFELESISSLSLPLAKSLKTLGTTSISLEDFLSEESDLAVEKWLDLVPTSNKETKPIGLRVAISVTIPTPAPYLLDMMSSRPIWKSSCLFPLPLRAQFAKSWTSVTDETGNLVLSLHMRDFKKSKDKKECRKRTVVGITGKGETCTLAEFVESEWSIVDSPWSLKLPDTTDDDGHLLELIGPHTVRLYPGGRLDYELKKCERHNSEGQLERHLITAVKFSAKEPYGDSVALLDLKSGTIKVKEEWFLEPSIILAFILKKEGYNSLISGGRRVGRSCKVESESNLVCLQTEGSVDVGAKENGLMAENTKKTLSSGGCGGGGCGGSGGCGNMAKSSSCGGSGGCGGGGSCGNVAKSGGCGGSGGCG
ncbi:hypothetical protein STAS_06697, partial [Striga asiatica]